MLLSCIPFSANADPIIWIEETDGYSYDNYQTVNVPSEVDFSGNYFWFSSSPPNWSDYQNFPGGCFLAFYYYLSLDNAEITENDGVFHFIWSNSPTPQFYTFTCFYTGSGKTLNDWSYADNTVTGCTDLYYDTSTGSVYTTTGQVSDFYTSQQNPPYEIKQQHLVLDGQVYDRDALRVHVDTGNQLSGEFTINNTDLFSVNVTNQGNTDVQWLFAIVERGTAVTFDLARDLSAADIVNHSSNIKYLLLRGENCLLPAGEHNSLPYTSLSQVGGVYTDYINAYVQTSFHHLGAGDSDSCHIFWEMVDLKPGVNYDCVAYAMKSYSDCTTFLLSPATNNLDMADTDTLTEVFRQPFTISNPKKYDSSVNVGGSGGLIANNGDSDYQAIHTDIHGYTDSGGNYYDYKGTYLGVSDYNVNNSTAGSSGKFNSLISQTNGVMRFFSQTLGYFPNEFLQVIQLGMFALVVIAIIKRVS